MEAVRLSEPAFNGKIEPERNKFDGGPVRWYGNNASLREFYLTPASPSKRLINTVSGIAV